MVVRKNKLYTPKISGQAKTFRRAMLAHLQGISPSAGGTPCHFFLNLIFCWQKCLYVFFLYWCFCPHWLRYSVSPKCRISFILYLRWTLVIFYRYVSFGKIIVLAFLHTLEIIHSWDKVVIKLTFSHLILTFAITSTNQPPPMLYLWHNNFFLRNCHKFYSKNY